MEHQHRFYRVTTKDGLKGPFEPIEELILTIGSINIEDYPLSIELKEMTFEEYEDLPVWLGW